MTMNRDLLVFANYHHVHVIFVLLATAETHNRFLFVVSHDFIVIFGGER